MKKEMNKRKIQAEQTKKNILAAARTLFLKYGYENVTVDSIVEAAGVSKGAFYVHFKSKDSLAALLMVDYVNEVDLDYQSFLDTLDPALSISDTLLSLTGKIADVIVNIIGYENIKMLYKSHLTKTIDTDAALSYDRALYKAFAAILEDGVRKGDFRNDLPVDTLAKHCILAIRGITYEWCIRYPDLDLKEQCLDHFQMLLKGIIIHEHS